MRIKIFNNLLDEIIINKKRIITFLKIKILNFIGGWSEIEEKKEINLTFRYLFKSKLYI